MATTRMLWGNGRAGLNPNQSAIENRYMLRGSGVYAKENCAN